jgi:hypothetical protein
MAKSATDPVPLTWFGLAGIKVQSGPDLHLRHPRGGSLCGLPMAITRRIALADFTAEGELREGRFCVTCLRLGAVWKQQGGRR